MKVRSVKLREAHGAIGGRASFCSILWDQQANHLVTASSSDISICIHDPLSPSISPKILRHHRDGVTALALSPNSTCLASGSIDRSVKLYKFPGTLFFFFVPMNRNLTNWIKQHYLSNCNLDSTVSNCVYIQRFRSFFHFFFIWV